VIQHFHAAMAYIDALFPVRIIVNAFARADSVNRGVKVSKEMDRLVKVSGDFKSVNTPALHPEQSGLSRYPLFNYEWRFD
jgi:hypothetical protein